MIETPILSAAKRELMTRMLAGKRQALVHGKIPRRDHDVTVPMSAAQRQVWLHAQMAPEMPLYNESITIHRHGNFELAVMERAVNELLRRHEIWRTAFEMRDGELVQVPDPDARIRLAMVDVSQLPTKARNAAALAIADEDARRPIDLTRAPLLRANVVKMAQDDHRLYLTLHHIVFDGVSIYRVVVDELAVIYDSFAHGVPSPLPEPTIQYADYALWHSRELQSPRIQQQLEYWRKNLANLPAKLTLTSDKPTSPQLSHGGAMEVFEISSALTNRLKVQSQRSGTTLYISLLTAFKTLIYRYTGAEDVLIGGVTDLRRSPELRSVVGYFLNTVTIRSHPNGIKSFSEYRAEVRDALLGALDASEVPFDQVVAALNIQRHVGTHPLFNILFSVEPPTGAFPAGWDLTQMDVSVGAAKFDLYLELDERPDGMVGRFLYCVESFEAATIRAMVRHWLNLLEEVATDPDRAIYALEILTAEEKHNLLHAWNPDPRPEHDAFLVDLITDQARENPARTAITSNDTVWSYAELCNQINYIARRLSVSGATKGDLIAVGLERGPHLIASLLAILKIGAIYVPLDLQFPKARIDRILQTVQPAFVLAQHSTKRNLASPDAIMLLIEEIFPDDRPISAVEVTSDALAYVIFTSGSTGQPKGVEVTHGALINLLESMRNRPGFTSTDVLLAVTTVAFDIAALEMFLPLFCGGHVVIASREVAANPLMLGGLLATSGATVLQATPTTWRALIDSGWTGQDGLVALCGGETLSRDLASKLRQRVATLWNMYGPTETTIWSLLFEVIAETGAVPVGWPIRNTVAHILDRDRNLVPQGAVGELHLGGAGIARGYFREPDRSEAAFIKVPQLNGTRLYRTGDLAYRRSDGAVVCLGRIDAQEKIRGFRVAVEEVEDALSTHPQVADAAVKSWPDELDGRKLSAYIVARRGQVVSPPQLRQHLRSILPDYMIPTTFDTIDALPLTPNRKLDRNALPPPTLQIGAEVHAAPQGEIEQKLAQIWRDILHLGVVGRHDKFADLGGHSLLVAKLLQRIHEEFGISLGMAEFFRNDRFSELACLLARPDAVPGMTFVPIQPNGSKPPLLWFDAGADFLALSEVLGPDQPLLGVPILSILDDLPHALNDFKQAARIVASEIRKCKPTGPYYLGGYCTFGILAYEVAVQLVADGCDVPVLILVHAINPQHYLSINRIALLASRVKSKITILSKGTVVRPYELWNLAKKGMALALLPSARHRLVNTHPTAAALEKAAYGYKPGRYSGDVLALQPLERVGILDASASWTGAVDGTLTAIDIPGAHLTIFKPPFVFKMGLAIRRHLSCLPGVQSPEVQ